MDWVAVIRARRLKHFRCILQQRFLCRIKNQRNSHVLPFIATLATITNAVVHVTRWNCLFAVKRLFNTVKS